jgi:hypothetical protein
VIGSRVTVREKSATQITLTVAGIIGMLLLLGVNGRARAESVLYGRVLDAQSNQPIAHAIVLAVWLFAEGAPGLVYSELVGVRETETDAEGQFALEDLSSPTTELRVTAYKDGYLAWSNLFTYPPLRRRARPASSTLIQLAPCPATQDVADHRLFIDLARSAGLYVTERAPRFQAASAHACGHGGGVHQ